MTDFESKLRLLYLLIDRIPEYVSANELGEKLNVSPRTIKRYAKSLKDIGLVDVRNGSKGGYAFDGKKSEILPFCFSGTYETILANLSIVNNSVIDRINQINVNRTQMHKDLMLTSNAISNDDLEKMVPFAMDIIEKRPIYITYSRFNENEDKLEKFDIFIKPICFKIYDGFIYLFAYYYDDIRAYALNRIERREDKEIPKKYNKPYEILQKDVNKIKNLSDHEIYGSDELFEFKISVKRIVYNRLKKCFKRDIYIDYNRKTSVISIKTRSYKETASLLLSCGPNISFLVKKDNPVYTEYKAFLDEMYKNNL